MWTLGLRVEHEAFHAGAGEFFARLAGEHHQYYPLQLIDVELRAIEGEQALNDDFTLLTAQNPLALKLKQVAAAIHREAGQFLFGEDPHGTRSRGLQIRSVTLAGEIREPIQGTFDLIAREPGIGQILREFLSLRYGFQLRQHVAVEHVYKYVENAAVVCHVLMSITRK